MKKKRGKWVKRPVLAVFIVFIMLLVFALVLVLHRVIDKQFLRQHPEYVDVMETAGEETDTEKNRQNGKNEIDYSVMSGTVTTVSEATPGQAFVADKKTLSLFRGYMFHIVLPEGIKAEDLRFQDDYMKRRLTIYYPVEYFEAFSTHEPEGLMTDVKRWKYKQGVTQGKLVITFLKTFAFHYCIEDGVLYVKYGSPSYYYDDIVVIDPGHGGEDYGAYTYNQSYIEKDIISAVNNYLYYDYIKQKKIMVYFTRVEDENYSLAQRIGLANDIDADLFISLHCNFLASWQGAARGVETAYNQKDASKPYNSKWLAEKLQNTFSHAVGLDNRGIIKGADLKVLRLAKMPACLLEMGFISDSVDAATLSNGSMQKRAAEAIEQVVEEALEEMKHE